MFYHPWAIVAGAFAAGLPVLVHLLTRPRPVRFPLSTLRFVLEIVQQRRARHRLRDILILTLRTLAVLFLALAMARPFWGRSDAVQTDENAQLIRVVVLDVSQSMAAVVHGIQTFERARPLAAQRLEYRNGMRVNLILAGARSQPVFEQPSTNFAALRDALTGAKPLPQELDVTQVLPLAAEMLAQGDPEAKRELIIISDFQRTNWATADFSAVSGDVQIELESVASEEVPTNLTVLRVATQGRPEPGRETRIEVEIGNYSPSPRTVRTEVTLGATVLQLSGVCGPYSKATLTGEVLISQLGWLLGSARLLDVTDSLSEDNVRSCVVYVRPPPKFALLSRQSATEKPASSYFLERALAPSQGVNSAGDATTGKDAAGSQLVTRLNPANLDSELLAGADLIVLDHPGRLSAPVINQLAGLLRRGRGILYVAAEAADASNLQQLLELTKESIRLPVEFVPPAKAQTRRNLFLTEMRREQSPFRLFGDDLASLIAPIRVSGGLETRNVEGALEDDVLAQLSDRSAFLVAATSDSGALMVLNADLGLSNLSGSPLFVPMLGELVQRLLGSEQAVREVASGKPFTVALPSEVDALNELQIVPPALPTQDAQSTGNGSLVRESAGVLWKGEAAGPPGVYRVTRRNADVFALATAVPAGESDLRALSAEVFQDRLAAGRQIRFHAARGQADEERDTLWSWLAVGCLVCFMCEFLTLKILRT
ncbi:MAG: hypothetical protein JWM11_3282 [Planctomycetaceae bacterium]|nr:hypothetical protein [Planctomycetaceae bacterium]